MRPWSTVCVSDRMLKTGGFCLSQKTNFFWKENHFDGALVSERVIPGAGYII